MARIKANPHLETFNKYKGSISELEEKLSEAKNQISDFKNELSEANSWALKISVIFGAISGFIGYCLALIMNSKTALKESNDNGDDDNGDDGDDDGDDDDGDGDDNSKQSLEKLIKKAEETHQVTEEDKRLKQEERAKRAAQERKRIEEEIRAKAKEEITAKAEKERIEKQVLKVSENKIKDLQRHEAEQRILKEKEDEKLLKKEGEPTDITRIVDACDDYTPVKPPNHVEAKGTKVKAVQKLLKQKLQLSEDVNDSSDEDKENDDTPFDSNQSPIAVANSSNDIDDPNVTFRNDSDVVGYDGLSEDEDDDEDSSQANIVPAGTEPVKILKKHNDDDPDDDSLGGGGPQGGGFLGSNNFGGRGSIDSSSQSFEYSESKFSGGTNDKTHKSQANFTSEEDSADLSVEYHSSPIIGLNQELKDVASGFVGEFDINNNINELLGY